MKKYLNLMVGIPGSGKSTFIQNHMNPDTDVWVSRDAIRYSVLGEKDAYYAKETYVRNAFFQLIEKYLKEGKNVWADATHLSVKSREKTLNRVRNLKDVKVNVYYFKVPIEYCIDRDATRSGRQKVGEVNIRRLSHRVDEPLLSNEKMIDKIFVVDETGNIIIEKERTENGKERGYYSDLSD